ncbi:hypothetical protein WR25_09287 [Diploscapter pachys]|uniref:B-related factor 1 n=1 Tax=Diploscapter pachys TaxID=2018661 RepID=A0A2A2LDV4_9BILA|nr:hypothetical protein WR25_09287 [Diploscapter pachys]
MGRACQNCGSTEIDEDHARGDATCMQCGTVIEESMVVSENQFVERAGGSGHLLVGQFVSAERGQTHSLQGVPGLTSQESREVTFQKGRKLIEEIASQLRINQHCVDTAHNFFKMCVTRNLTRGRLRTHVVAACLYMTCRIENTSHLLLDFSDVTQVNVFELGRTLSFISRSLRINLPTTDPCLYIMRFACLLEFGDKQKEVVTLATRLVERMKKDWISSGRRPTGLCGAALLIAARSHNFNRSISDVVRVVHISEAVVRKRLEEFGQTPSAALTIDEFSSIDLEACEDPPAYREAKKRVHEEQRRKEIAEAERVENELHPLEEALEKELEKKRREKFKKLPIAKLVAGDEMLDDDPEFGEAEDSLVRNEILKTVFNVADDRTTTQNPIDRYRQFRPSMETMGLKPSTSAASPMASGISGIGSPQFQLQGYAHANSTAADQRDPNDFEDIDDAEIDSYILTEAESVVKEKIWMKVNGEALEAIERRKREREEQEERDRNDPTKKKRRKPAPRKGPATSQTAAQAIEKVIQEKGLSKKVNYDILKEIESASMFDFGSAGTSNSVREDKSTDIIMNGHSLAAEEKEQEKELEQALTNAKPSLENIKGKEPIHSIQLTEQEIHLRKCNAYKKSTSGIEKLRSHFDFAVDPVTQMEEELKQQKEAERVAQIAAS